jgi:RimJ/RimL family protein N-acetyltransferase
MGGVFARSEKVLLRDPIPSDVSAYVHWMSHGEWRSFDAPWEEDGGPVTDARAAELKQRFLEMCGQEPPNPRVRPFIATRDNLPIGWVSRYGETRLPGAWLVGIDICDDRYLDRGLGTEALKLWIDYLFGQRDLHRLGLDTWSFNVRMAHVARKLGFVFEGAQRLVG